MLSPPLPTENEVVVSTEKLVASRRKMEALRAQEQRNIIVVEEMNENVADVEAGRDDADVAKESEEAVFGGLGDLDVGAEIPSAGEEARASASEDGIEVLESEQETEIIDEGRESQEGQVINDEEDESEVEIKQS